VSSPTKLSLHKHQFQRFTARSAPNFCASDFVPPAKSKNALQTLDVKDSRAFMW